MRGMNIQQLKQYAFNNLWYGEQTRIVRHGAIVSIVNLDGSRVWGVDVSHWNMPPVDFQLLKAMGCSFVIIKGCDGALNTKYFEEHYNGAVSAGLVVMMYVWLYPNNRVSVDSQVTAWADRYWKFPKLAAVHVDAEWTFYGGQPANPNATDLRSAQDKLKAKIGNVTQTYTAKGYADQYLKGFVYKEPLWVANYGVSIPNLPNGATTWEFWQFADNTTSAIGYDTNYYNGTQAQFEAEYGEGIVSPPPTGEPPMATVGTHKGVAFAKTNIKTAAGVVKVSLTAGMYVWGKLSSSGTDLIDFDHYYQANGTRVELGELCKCTRENMTVTTGTEPGAVTPPPVVTETLPAYLLAYDASGKQIGRYNLA
jgi:lysozyme